MTQDEKLFPNLRYDSLVSFAKDLSHYYDFIEKITLHKAQLNNCDNIKYVMVFYLPYDPGKAAEDLLMRLTKFKRYLKNLKELCCWLKNHIGIKEAITCCFCYSFWTS